MTESDLPRTLRHMVFQTSLLSALLDGVYDGDMTIGELLTHGDFGLGVSAINSVTARSGRPATTC